jgi:hypothetical protein
VVSKFILCHKATNLPDGERDTKNRPFEIQVFVLL